jgi:hypothetical protein
MLQSTAGFFNYCSRFMGLPKVSRLSVKLPDVNTRETYFIHREDPVGFEALKRVILEGLLVLLSVQLGLQCFSIEVAAFHGPRHEKRTVQPLQLGGNRHAPAAAAQSTRAAHPYRHSGPHENPHSNGVSALRTHIVVRIQQSDRGGFSSRY